MHLIACAVAKISAGLSGAELANVCNEAALLAGRKGANVRILWSLIELLYPYLNMDSVFALFAL